MRNTETNNQPPRLIIDGGGKSYRLELEALAQFLDNVNERCNTSERDDIIAELNVISDLVLDSTADNIDAEDLKSSLKLLQELRYLFTELLRSPQCFTA